MSKVTLGTVSNPQNLTSLASTINNNSAVITTAFDNTLSRDGTSPNTMGATLDMNSHQIINLPAPTSVNSPARLIDVVSNPTIVVPGTGTSGHVIPYLDGNNTWSGTNTYSTTSTFNGNVTFNGTVTGISTVIPGWLNTYSGKTANYTVVTGDNGKTLSFSGNTFSTVTFGTASSYATNFVAMIQNADTYPGGRGRKMTINGLSSFILYPGQQIMVFNNNNTWDYFPKAQRWKVPSSVIVYVDTSGSDSNDGLASGAGGAYATMQAAASAIWYQFDNAGTSATIAPTAGQTFSQQLNLGGQPLGNNVVNIIGNGGAFTWQTPPGGGTMLAVGDNAEVILQDIHFVSSNNIFGRAAVYLHNNGLADLNSGLTFQGGGVNDSALFTDNGSTIYTIANGFTVSNTFGDIIHMDEGGSGTISGVIAPSGATVATRLLRARYFARMIMGTQPQLAGWTSIGASLAEKSGMIDTNGVSIPGGTTTLTGGIVL